MAELIIIAMVGVILLTLGIIEKQRNKKNVEKIPLRVNINGIRGKSTATRLIFAILKEAGYQVAGKTTGTAARMFYWDEEEEHEVKRQPRGPNISEQVNVIKESANHGANALVCECMAVKPEYQKVYQHQIINANIVVIVNVLEDHLDEMGPTLDQIADAFAETIPYNGILIAPKCKYTRMFRSIAQKRNTKVITIDDNEVSSTYLHQFSYKLFPHNVAIGLAFARAMNIDKQTAMTGMLKANPDPGALTLKQVHAPEASFCLINAFAANDPASSLEIWNYAKEEKPGYAYNPVVILNCRPDRVDRTEQLVYDCIPFIENVTLFAVGEVTEPVTKAYENGELENVDEYHNLEGREINAILAALIPYLRNRIILCIGNIHGGGQELIDALEEYGSSPVLGLKVINNGRKREVV